MQIYNNLNIIHPNDMSEDDIATISAMDAHPPRTKFKPGDLAYLRSVPQRLAFLKGDRGIPQFWEIRFVVSLWAYELMLAVHSAPYLGFAGALERIHVPPNEYSRPMIYAHGFPHGMNPDSATWFNEPDLRRVKIRQDTQDWRTVLDCARAPFHGIDTDNLCAPFIWDIAPDCYNSGENIGSPFSYEEATMHTASLLGLESALVVPIRPWVHGIDRDHDVFGDE
jgi:hypothetical protein